MKFVAAIPLVIGLSVHGANVTNLPAIADKPWVLSQLDSLTNLTSGSLPTWSLFGIGFNGGQAAWPPTQVDERGFAVFSVDGETWGGGVGRPLIEGIAGHMRDPALAIIGPSFYGLTYTTNSATNNSLAVAVHVSTNLTRWIHAVNISMALPGETHDPTKTYHWAPTLTVVGTNVWLFANVATNGATGFIPRYRTTHVNNFPGGWSDAALLNNGTGATNFIDLAPFVMPDGSVVAWYVNLTSGSLVQGAWASPDPASSFTNILTGVWGGGLEGCWMTRLPNGRYRLYAVRYLYGSGWAAYGNNGGGQALVYAESTTGLGSWSSALTNTYHPFFVQNFKPIALTNDVQQAFGIAGLVPGLSLRGTVNIGGQKGRGPGGLSLGGFAYSNPHPNPHPTGLDTNDYAALNFGNENRSRGGLYARGDGRVALYVPTFTSTDTNIAFGGWTKDVLTARSNRVDIDVPLYVQGSLMTNGGGGGAGTPNALTNYYQGNIAFTGNLIQTNTSINSPYIEMYSTATPSGNNLASYIKQKRVAAAQGWTQGIVPNQAEKYLFSLSESPWTHILSLNTNGQIVAEAGSMFAGRSGIALFGTNTAPAGLTERGAHLYSDGTNVNAVLQNAAGVRSTNSFLVRSATFTDQILTNWTGASVANWTNNTGGRAMLFVTGATDLVVFNSANQVIFDPLFVGAGCVTIPLLPGWYFTNVTLAAKLNTWP